MIYSYKYRLKPTKEQQVLLNKHFGHVRFLFNHFLNERICFYKQTGKSLNYYDNQNEIPTLKQKFPWLKEVGSQALQYSARALQNAYNNFFRKIQQKIPGKKGFPQLKNKSDNQSFKIMQNIKIIEGKLSIPKFKDGIKLIYHRLLEGEIKFATISKNKLNQYFVSITVERDVAPLPTNNNEIGIDINVKAMVTSNETIELNTRPAKKYKKRINLLHKNLSRKKKGSNGRKKAKQKLAKLHLKITNQREDFLHKLSKKIIDENQVICIEDLNVASMLVKVNPENRKEPRWQERLRHFDITDSGFASFSSKLIYKAKLYGRELVQIGKFFPSSQLCSHCGWKNIYLLPADREWGCYQCFSNHERDVNSAINILNEGQRILGTRRIADCPDVSPTTNSGQLVGSEASTI